MIDVLANDSINSILGKINASAAGVTATFDAQNERVRITGNTADGRAIALGNDSSGFLAAVKLDSPSSFLGAAATPELTQDVALAESLPSVAGGSLRIKGTAIAIDPSDSLRTVLARIDAAGGVNLAFDENSGRVRLSGDKLVLEDETGFLDAIGIGERAIRPPRKEVSGAVPLPSRAAEAFLDLAGELREALPLPRPRRARPRRARAPRRGGRLPAKT